MSESRSGQRHHPSHEHSLPRRSTRCGRVDVLLAAVLTAVAAAVAGWAAPATAANGPAAPTVGYIRAAHLVPELPEMAMDVTLSSFAGSGAQPPVVSIEASYGDVGSYSPIAPGFYAVTVRPSAAPSTTPPVLATTIEIEPGLAYTVAGVGTPQQSRLTVFSDDLTMPAAGSAKIRVVNAARSASPANVTVSDGTPVASGAGYAAPTSYAEVRAGSWQLRASAAGAPAVADSTEVDLASGSVYTLLLLENTTGGLRVLPVLDSAGSGVVPQGGVAAGFGGAVAESDRPGDWLLLVAALGALTAAAGVALRRRAGHHR